jgi:hypothetical protein
LSQKCLDVNANDTADGANLIQWECLAGATNQQYQLVAQ